MKPCRALMGYPSIATPKAPRAKRVAPRKARAPLPLCIFCHLRWVAKVQHLTCSVACAQSFRRSQKERRNRRTDYPETLTYPEEALP